MDTFDEFLDKARNLVDIAGKKTGEAMEFAKLKLSRAQVNGEIQKTYEKLGAFVYKFKKQGDENNELVDNCIAEIDGLIEELDSIERKLNEIKSAVKCESCGAINDMDSAFCAKCGAKIEVPEPEATEYAEDEPEEDYADAEEAPAEEAPGEDENNF